MNDDIFEPLEADAFRPRPLPRPARFTFTADQLRAELGATPGEELERLVEQAENLHHALVLEAWTEEKEAADLREGAKLLDDLLEVSTELVEDEEAARERARNRGLSGGSGGIAILSGDDERPEPSPEDRLPCDGSSPSVHNMADLLRSAAAELRDVPGRAWTSTFRRYRELFTDAAGAADYGAADRDEVVRWVDGSFKLHRRADGERPEDGFPGRL